MLRHVARPGKSGAPASFASAPESRARPPAEAEATEASPEPGFPVYLVEPDRNLRMARTRALTEAGFPTRPFAATEDLVATVSELAPGCVVIDIAEAGSVAEALREEGREDALRFPTILVYTRLNPPDAVAAVRLGAADLLHRAEPFAELLAALLRAAPKVREARMRLASSQARATIASLTPREREVIACIMNGLSSKRIARILNISPRTVEMHRARIHRRLGVRSVGELLALLWHAKAVGAD